MVERERGLHYLTDAEVDAVVAQLEAEKAEAAAGGRPSQPPLQQAMG